MESVFNFILSNISRAFRVMSEFELFAGLSLLDFLVVLLLLHVIISMFFSHLPSSPAGKVLPDKAKNHNKDNTK